MLFRDPDGTNIARAALCGAPFPGKYKEQAPSRTATLLRAFPRLGAATSFAARG